MLQTDLADPVAAEDHRRRVRYLATFYPWLQGLRILPMGVLFLAGSIWLMADPAAGVRDDSPRFGVAMAVALAGGFVAQIPIGAWYRRTFGSATMSSRSKKLMVLLLLISALLGGLSSPVMALKPFPKSWLVPVALVLTAVLCAIYYWVTGRVARHYLWLGAFALALAAPHAAGVSLFCDAATALRAPGLANCLPASLLFYVGVLLVPGALLDHRLLARTLARRTEEEPG